VLFSETMRGIFSLASLLRSQWYSEETLRKNQLVLLRNLLQHASEKVPRYSRMMKEAGLVPQEVVSLNDLTRIPVTSKTDLQTAPSHEIVERNTHLARCVSSRTSGATGIPLQIVTQSRDRSQFHPSFLRVYMAWGMKPWHRSASFQARPEALDAKSWYEYLNIFPRRILNSLAEPEDWVKELREWTPFLLLGYVLTLKLLAEYILEKGIEDLRIPLVASTSGTLDQGARQMFKDAFGGRICDIYASEEAGGVIAWECPVCDGYHVDIDHVVLELMDSEMKDESCEDREIIVTNLCNKTMPFIRYAQGDLGQPSQANPVCGRGLPLLSAVSGRVGDFVMLPSGGRLTPHPFFLALDNALGVGQWRLTQDASLNIHVEIVPRDDWSDLAGDEVREKIRSLVGEGPEIQIRTTGQLRKDPFQKLRSVVSEAR